MEKNTAEMELCMESEGHPKQKFTRRHSIWKVR
jgi:hypothetical protein